MAELEAVAVGAAEVVELKMAQDRVSLGSKKYYIVSLVALILVGILFFGSNITGNALKDEEVQTVVIDMVDWQYHPLTIEVEKDVPVRIYLSDNVYGCFRDLVIPELGKKKYLATSSDYLEVTFPEGKYTFACSMYMGTGRIISK